MDVNPLAQILRRPSGRGWLVAAGSSLTDEFQLRAQALVDCAGSVLVVAAPGAEEKTAAEAVLLTWTVASGWPGKLLVLDEPTQEEPDAARDAIGEASVILLPEAKREEALVSAINDLELMDAFLAALEDGALVVAEGSSCEWMGEVVSRGAGEAEPAWGWLPQIILQSHFLPGMDCPVLRRKNGLIRLGLPEDSALAFGPDGERQFWGAVAPTLTFGAGWGV